MKEYLYNVVSRLIQEKAEKNVAPAGVILEEVMVELKDDALEIMRELHREKKIRGNKTLNSILFTKWEQ